MLSPSTPRKTPVTPAGVPRGGGPPRSPFGLVLAVFLVLLGFVVGRWAAADITPPPFSNNRVKLTRAVETAASREAHVARLLSHVEPDYQDMCRDMLQGKAATFSQGWQDWMIYHNFVRDRQWGDGFYLDIGANNATFISNTLFFDKCLGWRGICAEPQTRYHADIRAKRGCDLHPTCVLGKDTKVTSTLAGGDFKVVEAAPEGGDAGMECAGIESLQQKYGFAKIDLVSIDIEGNEPSVLRCWPFTSVETSMFLVETNKQSLAATDMFFHRNGYVNAESFGAKHTDGTKASLLDNLYVRDPKEYPHPPLGSAFSCNPKQQGYMGRWCYDYMMSLPEEHDWFDPDQCSE